MSHYFYLVSSCQCNRHEMFGFDGHGYILVIIGSIFKTNKLYISLHIELGYYIVKMHFI